jgi:DNA-binding XRE family transcriptional regulator
VLLGARQVDVAVKAHVGRSTVVRAEKGESLRPAQLAAIEQVLGVATSTTPERAQS